MPDLNRLKKLARPDKIVKKGAKDIKSGAKKVVKDAHNLDRAVFGGKGFRDQIDKLKKTRASVRKMSGGNRPKNKGR